MECVSVKDAQYLSDYKIKLIFNTGEEGVVDLEDLIFSSPAAEPLRDKDEFAKFYLDEWKTLAWPCDFGVAPEFLYEQAEINEQLELMEQEEDEDYLAGKYQSLHEISYNHIESAYLFVSSGEYGMNTALICKDSGRILRRSDMSGEDEIEEAEEDGTLNWHETVEVPHRNDLDLGQNMVFEFINKELPNEYDRVRDIFSRKGSYSRYKTFLERCGKLDEWHEFENKREKKALLEWCKENGILLED